MARHGTRPPLRNGRAPGAGSKTHAHRSTLISGHVRPAPFAMHLGVCRRQSARRSWTRDLTPAGVTPRQPRGSPNAPAGAIEEPRTDAIQGGNHPIEITTPERRRRALPHGNDLVTLLQLSGPFDSKSLTRS